MHTILLAPLGSGTKRFWAALMLKLCSQGLLFLAAMGFLAFSLSLRKEIVTPAATKTPALDRPSPGDRLPANELSADPLQRQPESRVTTASANVPLPRRQSESPMTGASAADSLPPHREPSGTTDSANNSLPPSSERPATMAEAEAFATSILNAIVLGDAESFRTQFDLNAFAARAFPAIDGNTPVASQLRAVVESKLHEIGPQLIDVQFHYIRANASYNYLRTINRNDGPRSIFRLVDSDGLLNYHELHLVRRPQGIRAVDLFVYASGEPLSVTLQRTLLTLLPPDKQSRIANLSKSCAASLHEVLTLDYMHRPWRSGDYESVLAIYESLPKELRATKSLQAIRLSAARKVSEAEHAAAIDEYRKIFPDDPSTYLKYLHPHLPTPAYADFYCALDRLDEFVGGDPYLQALRASAASGTRRHGHFAQVPAIALKDVNLGENVVVTLPKDFQVQKVTDKPVLYMAIGPSPNETGNHRPAIFLFPSAPEEQQGREAYLATAKKAAANTMNRFGLRVTDSRDIEKKVGIDGTNMTADNGKDQSWWAVRTLHNEKCSLQVVIGAFEKETFDQLTELVSNEAFIAK